MQDPTQKYRPYPAVSLPHRHWPNRVHTSAPRWLSTDLRDGNQALFEPLTIEQKLQVFDLLCRIGFKEIEVGFPSASQTEFDFVRRLIEDQRIPSDVTIQVLTQARDALIDRTLAAVAGASSVVIHVYNATSPTFREVVFGLTPEAVKQLAVEAVTRIREGAQALAGSRVYLEYSPECFSATELPVALSVCDAVVAAWDATPENPVILNLPATVEVAMPNVYADQVEWMHTHLAKRESVVLSVHPHNDRGTGVAAAELAVLAGADRVEGCLFGNGERTGNVDLVTLALNLHTQGIACGLDLSNMNEIAAVMTACTQLPVHPRHPYAGDLVFTAFSGSHQDAIKKGMAVRDQRPYWDVPYLPLDPKDIGRTYDSLVRVNSQSGKGGIAYLLETVYGLILPRRLQVEFSAVIQRHTDVTGAEASAEQIYALFAKEYLASAVPVKYVAHHLFDSAAGQGIKLEVLENGVPRTIEGEGNGPIAATVAALGQGLRVLSYEERSLGQGADTTACAFVECQRAHEPGSRYGAGRHENIVTASVLAVISAFNRSRR